MYFIARTHRTHLFVKATTKHNAEKKVRRILGFCNPWIKRCTKEQYEIAMEANNQLKVDCDKADVVWSPMAGF